MKKQIVPIHPKQQAKAAERLAALESAYQRSTAGTQNTRNWMETVDPAPEKTEEKAANAEYVVWLKSIGAEGTQLDSLEKLREARYNNTNEYQLLMGYGRAVEKGDISPLIGFALYKRTSDDIRKAVIGQSTSTGVEIKRFSTHFIDRIIGQTADAHEGMRQGVPISEVLDALQNPVKLGEVQYLADGDVRQTFYGNKAAVTLSIRDGLLVQTNPRKGK